MGLLRKLVSSRKTELDVLMGMMLLLLPTINTLRILLPSWLLLLLLLGRTSMRPLWLSAASVLLLMDLLPSLVMGRVLSSLCLLLMVSLSWNDA